MNKNKAIFWAIWVILVFVIILVVYGLSKASDEPRGPKSGWPDDFIIWLMDDSSSRFNTYLNQFKKVFPNYEKTKFNVVSFDDYEVYKNALIWAFLRWNWPDIFVLNNNETNIFENQIYPISSWVVSIDDFKRSFNSTFQNRLIKKNRDDEEYLEWVPIWYESLGLFYNFRTLWWKDLYTWSQVDNAISSLNDDNKTWIWLWDGTTTKLAVDIATQFMIQDGLDSLDKGSSNTVKSALGRYKQYYYETWNNNYEDIAIKNRDKNLTNVDAFWSEDIQMIIWYPSLLEEISKTKLSKSFIRWSTFPTHTRNKLNALINYNYFVINKDTPYAGMATDFIYYISTVEWQQAYLDTFDYYMPSRLSLVDARLDQKINSSYDIKYTDFYNSSFELVDMNKQDKNIYDSWLKNILDMDSWNSTYFEALRKRLICIWDQTTSIKNAWKSCN